MRKNDWQILYEALERSKAAARARFEGTTESKGLERFIAVRSIMDRGFETRHCESGEPIPPARQLLQEEKEKLE